MRFVLNLLAMFAVALAIGFGLSWFTLTDGRLFGAYRVGPWAAWPDIGLPTPDPYTRAYLSRTGLLQLGQAEGIQFTAVTDSDGEPLDRDCTYRIDGQTPVASFWSLVAIDEDGTNIALPEGLEAIHSSKIAREGDGSAVISVSKRLAPYNWLEITGEGEFELVLTLYDASIFAQFGSTVDAMPSIINEGCA